MTTGLVLEGGAMRALYTAGILDVWMDEGIRVDALFGTSAGAIFGANLFSGQRGRGLRYNLRYMPDKRYISVRSWLTTGDMFNKDFAYYRMTNELDPFDEAAFERYGGAFYVIATNVETGEAECLRVNNMVEQLETMRATSALPFFSRMVEVNGKHYLDGGVSNSIPVWDCLERGYDRVIVILTQPADYRKQPMNPTFIRLRYGRYPKLRDALLRRHEVYNAQCEDVARLEAEGRVFVIRPESPLGIGRMEREPARLQAVYDRGTADGMRTLAAVRAYLA